MGDPTHLEKMGRELKCPICLSLLDNAVSLTCNHFFCNSCIVKSMKSGSDCPVCKLPYRRREIRAAPHMDNLVSIYKSMEIASGFNIFVTQNPPPSTKLSDVDCGREDNDRLCRDMSEEQLNITRQKDLRKLDKSHTELSGPITLKPSFPTKKRVQVPRTLSFRHIRHNLRSYRTGSREIKKDDFKNDSSVSRENPAVDERGERMLLPFFWLRDEDGEKSSQHSDVDQLLDITPPNVPTFSDIKDSDDDTPPESPSKGAVCGSKSNVADFFDSEMFEWTQRACSPEIFPSPAKMQAEKTAEMDGIRERNSETPPLDANTNEERSDESKICIYTIPRMGASEDILANLSSPIVKSASYQIESNTSNKRGRNARDTTLRNCARKIADKDTGATVVATRVSGKTTEKTLANKGCVLISGKIGEWKKDGRLKGENVSSVSVTENSNQGDENTVTDQMPISLDQKQGRSNLKRKKNGKVSREDQSPVQGTKAGFC
uniref:RING-type domain-containing protein n=1 Tax=Salix viminalis TaxID=40686 RepID=A0A6N2M6Z3_SALVM